MNADEFKKLLIEQEERLAKRLGKQLDEKLDKRFQEQETRLDKRFDEKLDERLEKNNAVLFGQLSKHFDERTDALEARLGARIERLEVILDRDTKRTETDEQERLAMGSKLHRHEGWIGQLAEATGTKLVPEQ
jgi:cytidylate kinase